MCFGSITNAQMSSLLEDYTIRTSQNQRPRVLTFTLPISPQEVKMIKEVNEREFAAVMGID